MNNLRDIITIDRTLCDGCGVCVKGCHEGALKIVDGKAELVSEIYCDGLGDCIGECPQGAITIEKREAKAYDEVATQRHMASLKSDATPLYSMQGGLASESTLSNFPIQLHLVNPLAPHFVECDLLLAADCTAFAYARFHNKLLRGRKLVIACPKLDSNKGSYIEKLVAMIETSRIKSLKVAIMEVPCCRGLMGIVDEAVARTSKSLIAKVVVIGRNGEIIA